MTELLTPEDVAETLGISPALVRSLTRDHDWPCVRFSAKTIRYRTEHVEQIVALHEKKPSTPTATTTGLVGLPGQTKRSQSRAAS